LEELPFSVAYFVVVYESREYIAVAENELLSWITISKILFAEWLAGNLRQDASIEYDDDQSVDLSIGVLMATRLGVYVHMVCQHYEVDYPL